MQVCTVRCEREHSSAKCQPSATPRGDVWRGVRSPVHLVVLDREKQQADIYDAAKASAEVEKTLPSARIAAIPAGWRTRNK